MNDYVQFMPCFFVVYLFKSIELWVVSSSIRVDFGLQVFLESTSHDPFAINEATVSNQQRGTFTIRSWQVSFITNRAHAFVDFSSYWRCHIPSADDYKLPEDLTLLIHAVAKPTKAVFYFSVPRIFNFPIYFLDIFNSIESKIYAQTYWWRHYFRSAYTITCILIQVISSQIKHRQIWFTLNLRIFSS